MISRLETLTGKPVPCPEEAGCLNGPSSRGAGDAKCRNCRLALEFGGTGLHWKHPRGHQHPVIAKEKRLQAMERAKQNQEDRKNKDRGRQKLGRSATRSEGRTQAVVKQAGGAIQATRNSGRTARDADYIMNISQTDTTRLTLDNKLQSQRIHPLVHLPELDKVRADAKRAGSDLGALIITTQLNRRIIAFDLTDFIQAYGRPLETHE